MDRKERKAHQTQANPIQVGSCFPAGQLSASAVALGETNGQALLTEQEVVDIRQLYLSGEWSYGELASSFGVTKSTIQTIVAAVNWRWLLGEGEEQALAKMREERRR